MSTVLLLLGIGLSPTTAAADTLEELEARQRELQARQDAYSREREQVEAALEGTNVVLAETYLALQDINARLPVAQAELATAKQILAGKEREAAAIADRLAVAEAQQAELSDQIAEGEAAEDRTRMAVGQLARSTYRDGLDVSVLALVFEATTAEELATRYSALDTARRTQTQALVDLENTIAIRRNSQARLDAVQERIVVLKGEADAAVDAAEDARNVAEARTAEFERLQREAQDKAAQLEAQRAEYEAQQLQIEADNRAVANQIIALAAQEAAERARIAAEQAAREQAARDAQASRSSNQAAPAPVAEGVGALLIPPVNPPLYVTSPYGYRVYPITGGWFMHPGVDLRSACGNPQYASAAGTVVKIGYTASNGTHGNQVIINHGVLAGRSTVTVYNHLSRFAVSYGQRVAQGQVIGYTGTTGASTGCHVHFELWLNGATVDPMKYI